MQTIIPDTIRNIPEVGEIIERSTKALETEPGNSPDVKAAWNTTEDQRGRILFEL